MNRTIDRVARLTHPLVLKGVDLRCEQYRRRNVAAKNILVYTDSRGYDIIGWWRFRNPFYSYMAGLVRGYNVDVQIVPEFSTTLIDFLAYYDRVNGKENFDAVVLHCGIVDFSRRHKSTVERFYKEKNQEIISRLFTPEEIDHHLASETGFHYEGEPTRSFYSLDMAERIVEVIERIPNLIWIGCHGLVNGWRGNYWKERPKDMQVVVDYSKLFSGRLEHAVRLEDWDNNDIMRYTYDNVHLNREGLTRVRNMLEPIVDTVLEQ